LAPTDPGMPDSGIRLVGSWTCGRELCQHHWGDRLFLLPDSLSWKMIVVHEGRMARRGSESSGPLVAAMLALVLGNLNSGGCSTDADEAAEAICYPEFHLSDRNNCGCAGPCEGGTFCLQGTCDAWLCGNGLCDADHGETPETCNEDCVHGATGCPGGACGGQPTLPGDVSGGVLSLEASCGDGVCVPELGEGCESCLEDCGQCVARCLPEQIEWCGMCGWRMCNYGYQWGPCQDEGECLPGEVSTLECETGSLRVCEADCVWGDCR